MNSTRERSRSRDRSGDRSHDAAATAAATATADLGLVLGPNPMEEYFTRDSSGGAARDPPPRELPAPPQPRQQPRQPPPQPLPVEFNSEELLYGSMDSLKDAAECLNTTANLLSNAYATTRVPSNGRLCIIRSLDLLRRQTREIDQEIRVQRDLTRFLR